MSTDASYAHLLEQLAGIEDTLAQLQLLSEYEKEASPAPHLGRNLLDYLSRGKKDALQGQRLEQAIVAVQTQKVVIERLLAEYNDQRGTA